MSAPLLQVESLAVRLQTAQGERAVVDDLSFAIDAGETLALVGESGSGKSQTALALMGLSARGARLGGRMLFDGEDLLSASAERRRQLRGPAMAMVFQDPMSSLNPYLSVGLQLAEVLETHRGATRGQALAEAECALDAVGLSAPRTRLAQYPHELSGGMRQRVMIAMAMLARPRLLIADEPTTALDPTVQRQILRLLERLRREQRMALLFITHDLGLVAEHCERVLVMYAGQVVESGATAQLLRRPRHPYTAALLNARPGAGTRPGTPLAALPGQPPDPRQMPPGCRFEPRCALRQADCRDPGLLWQSDAQGSRGWRCRHPLASRG